MALRARCALISGQLADCFELPADEAADFVRRTLKSWEDFLGGRRSSHILVYHQPRFRRTEVRRWRERASRHAACLTHLPHTPTTVPLRACLAA